MLRIVFIAAVAAVIAVPAAAQTRAQAPAVTPGLQAVFDCRRISDDAARVACFDRSVGALQSAFTAREVVVVDREQARAARREAFGFSLPSLSMLNPLGGGDSERETFKVARATQGADGYWVIETETGQVWRQTEAATVRIRPRPGSTLEIRRGPLGSYRMNVDGSRAISVMRSR